MSQNIYSAPSIRQFEDSEVVIGSTPSHGTCRQPLHPRELEVASQVQQKLFPKQMPEAPGWEFAGLCRPARVLAGDYYDVFGLAPGQVAFALGDVAGKGLGPSLVMAGLHAMIRGRLPHQTDALRHLVQELNHYLVASTPEEMFVTLFLGVLDESTGRLRFVNAGHPPPLLITAEGCKPVRLAKVGALLGIVSEVDYEEGEVHVQPGSLLALFSDGVTDARNEQGERFEEKRLIEVVREARSSPAAVVLSRIVEAVERFAVMSELNDDITLIVIRRQSH